LTGKEANDAMWRTNSCCPDISVLYKTTLPPLPEDVIEKIIERWYVPDELQSMGEMTDRQ